MTGLAYAPPPFVTAEGEQVVFVDFTHARYQLEFDADAAQATAVSQIAFRATHPGRAAISMNQPVNSARLNGDDVDLLKQDSPHADVSLKVLSQPVSPGTHTLIIKSCISEPGPYGPPIMWLSDPARLHCIFNMSDLRNPNGGYLEAFLPSNYNFDQFRISMSVTVKNSNKLHSVFSNGSVLRSSPEHWRVEFPSYFTSSCPWFHLGPSDEYQSLKDLFSSSNGRTIPIFVYTKSSRKADGLLKEFVNLAKSVLVELESDFGPFPHGSVTIFATGKGRGGMEYAGATATGLKSLRHELNHSYFARSIMPANGDAGWIDEAIASWGDIGYLRSKYPPEWGANMGRRSEYVRTTNDDAYTVGRDFLAHLDYLLRERGGLKPFLATYAKKKRHQAISTPEFQELVEDFYGKSLQELFEFFVFSEKPSPQESVCIDAQEDPHRLKIE